MKLGIVFNSDLISHNQYVLLSRLKDYEDIELYAIYLVAPNYSSNHNTKIINHYNSEEKKHPFSKILLKFQKRIELELLKTFAKETDFLKKSKFTNINFEEIVEVYGDYDDARLGISLRKIDKTLIKNLNLDILLLLDTPYLIEKKDSLSRLGTLSLDDGNIKKQQVSLNSFWSIYYEHPSTGFDIYFRPSTKLYSLIIFIGHITTKNLFWQRNFFFIRQESYDLIYNIIIKISKGYVPKEELFSEQMFLENSIPNWHQIIKYQLNIVWSGIKKLKKQLFKQHDYWTVYYETGSFDELDYGRATKIRNPKRGFFADPFIFNFKNRDILFVEEYIEKEKKAVISAIEIISGTSYKYLGEVIREEFHLSYPFVFEFNDDLFIVPETSGISAIRLYKCIDFPLKWEYQYDLISNIDAADTTIHFIEKCYWLFTNTKEKCGNFNSILDIYYSDSPISQNWSPHDSNPVYLNNGARNGGYIYNDELNRVISQAYGFDTYGKSIIVREIKTISPTMFEWETVKEINLDYIKGIKGTHHLCCNSHYICFDTLSN